MDKNLIPQATKINDTTMAVPQAILEPIIITLDQINARIADRQIAMQGLQEADSIDQALLHKANALGLKTTQELAQIDETPV